MTQLCPRTMSTGTMEIITAFLGILQQKIVLEVCISLNCLLIGWHQQFRHFHVTSVSFWRCSSFSSLLSFSHFSPFSAGQDYSGNSGKIKEKPSTWNPLNLDWRILLTPILMKSLHGNQFQSQSFRGNVHVGRTMTQLWPRTMTFMDSFICLKENCF